ncbi:MAG: ammonium transporter [Actinomycetes bacterium]
MARTLRRALPATATLLLLLALPAGAQEEAAADPTYAIDTVWIAVAGALVFLMQMGFGLVETGLTRSKNAVNIMTKNAADLIVGVPLYTLVGVAFAYGTTKGGLIGFSGFGDPEGLLGDGVQFAYQLAFAAAAATIVSGAVAERMKFSGYLVMSAAMTAFIYPIVSHWQWGGGWLSELGYYDFAGSSIVHLVGGVAGLMGALILGPRIGKYAADGTPRAIPGHNIPFVLLGVFVLWFGWWGFNGGSTLAAVGQEATIGHILVTTNMAGAMGAIAAAAFIWIRTGKPDSAMIGNGALAGLVGITAGPDLASIPEAMLVGTAAGLLVVAAVLFLDRIRIDDPVGAVAVHGVCGALGTLAVGLYADGRAAGYSIGTQAIGVAAIAGFVAVTAGLVFLALKVTIGIRVSEQEEIEGLDVHEHGLEAYPGMVSGGRATVAAPSGVAAPVAVPVTEG